MKWLESIVNRVTMYTLIGIVLTVILVTATVLSLFGAISFSPIALAVSTAVFLGVSIGANLLFGKLYGISTHIPSAAITALILACLFTPTLEFGLLLQYGFIALIAMASKYVVAYKSRHIFNPAAIGALMGGVLSLQFASWWIATPGLFFVVALGAFVVLYKTRMLRVAGVFMAVSIGLIVAAGLVRGEVFAPLLAVALTSWPILFLAGFMLSEPLTLPPRAFQKNIIAVVMAIVVAIPVSIGTFHTSPELAIVFGNLVAFIFAFKQRRGLNLKLVSHSPLTPSVDEYTLSSEDVVRFEPGQYIELFIPHAKQDERGVRRSFSITSKPNEKTLSLGIKFYDPSSSFKKALRQLPIGSSIQATGITGDFVLPKNPNEKLLFVAGGIGITPFISHIRSLRETRDITLLYFIRTPEEAAYQQLLDSSGVTVHYFVADGAGGTFLNSSYMTQSIAEEWVTHLPERTAYISGPPMMVNATKKILRGKVKKMHTDYFSGY